MRELVELGIGSQMSNKKPMHSTVDHGRVRYELGNASKSYPRRIEINRISREAEPDQIKNIIITDRLSDLPDHILHHILSFLHTQSSVQTSILSRRWRSLWKYVPILTFDTDLFRTQLDFEHHVDRFLSLRSGFSVCQISTLVGIDVALNSIDVFDRIIKHAASHGIQHLNVGRLLGHPVAGKSAVTAVSGCYRSLKILELDYTELDEAAVRSLSRLQQLETLKLYVCRFNGLPEDGFARLENLELLSCSPRPCSSDRALKIYGTQLLRLAMRRTFFCSIEIVAPKLEYLCFRHSNMRLLTDFSKSKLPCLDRADVYLGVINHELSDISKKQPILEWCASLFNVLYNIRSLDLEMHTFELLIQTCDIVKHQSSPFKRIKSLNLKYFQGSHELPYEVIRYFLQGSRDEELKPQFTIEKSR